MDIRDLDQRLRPEWFYDYVLNPATYRSDTLMPALWPLGETQFPGILEGDTRRQILSIWAFIKEGEGAPQGFPEQAAGEFEIVPKDRPIVLRTFLKGVGTKAILIGFPEGIHLAYDGDKGRPAFLWRGRFFDAYNTWFSRFAPFESPLEENVIRFEQVVGARDGRRFRGYDLDKHGNPTFVITEDGRRYTDKFEASDRTLKRTIQWHGEGAPEISHPKGVMKEVEKGAEAEIVTIVYKWRD